MGNGVWVHPLARNIDADDPAHIQIHRQIIESKRLLKEHYLRWYREFLPAYHETARLSGPVLEIGCGSGFLEEIIPDIVKTDVTPNPFAHKQMDAMAMDHGDESVRAIFETSALHHMAKPEKFLREAQRCLKPGGRLVLIEPSNGILERVLCRILNHYEYHDSEAPHWENVSPHPMTNANLSLPWIIFIRDRKRFAREFPRFRIRGIRYHTFISYIVTGGMTYRQFLPDFAAPLVGMVEQLTMPFMRGIGESMTIDLEKV